MDELTKRASDSATRFAELSQTIKDAEKRMAEIAAKDAFGLLEGGVPKLKALNQEYSELLKKKNNKAKADSRYNSLGVFHRN